METMQKLEDRYLIALVLVIFLVAFSASGNEMIGDMMKVLVGSFGTIIVSRSDKLLMVGEGAQARAIVEEFTKR